MLCLLCAPLTLFLFVRPWVCRDSYLPQGSHGLKAVTKYKLGESFVVTYSQGARRVFLWGEGATAAKLSLLSVLVGASTPGVWPVVVPTMVVETAGCFFGLIYADRQCGFIARHLLGCNGVYSTGLALPPERLRIV